MYSLKLNLLKIFTAENIKLIEDYNKSLKEVYYDRFIKKYQEDHNKEIYKDKSTDEDEDEEDDELYDCMIFMSFPYFRYIYKTKYYESNCDIVCLKDKDMNEIYKGNPENLLKVFETLTIFYNKLKKENKLDDKGSIKEDMLNDIFSNFFNSSY